MLLRLVTLLALLAVTGCGSAGAPVKTADTSFTLTLDDYTIRPQDLRVGLYELTISLCKLPFDLIEHPLKRARINFKEQLPFVAKDASV